MAYSVQFELFLDNRTKLHLYTHEKQIKAGRLPPEPHLPYKYPLDHGNKATQGTTPGYKDVAPGKEESLYIDNGAAIARGAEGK